MWKIQRLYTPVRFLPFVFPGIGAQRRNPGSDKSIMVTADPISDMLTRIRNGYMAGKDSVAIPWSKMKEGLAKILTENGYLSKQEVKETDGKKELVVILKYAGKTPAITEIRRVSRPSLRVYANKNNLPRVLGGMGLAVISTPKGLVTNKQARKEGMGGEVICILW